MWYNKWYNNLNQLMHQWDLLMDTLKNVSPLVWCSVFDEFPGFISNAVLRKYCTVFFGSWIHWDTTFEEELKIKVRNLVFCPVTWKVLEPNIHQYGWQRDVSSSLQKHKVYKRTTLLDSRNKTPCPRGHEAEERAEDLRRVWGICTYLGTVWCLVCECVSLSVCH